MLQIKNLSKSYGAKKAVSNLSFVVEDGDIMGFIGKNGAGKTTTLKACLGIIGIDEGEILLDGTSVLKEPLACKQKMAYVPDNPQLDEYMTGLQYINFICDIYEVPSKMRKQNFEKLALDSTGVANSFWPRNVVVFGVPVACVLLNLISGFTVRQKENAKPYMYYIMAVVAFVATGIMIYLGMK